jgi:hypothetical protein
MLKLLFLNIVSAVLLISCSKGIKEKELPSIVLNSFETKFIDAVETKWLKKNNIYEVEFELTGTEYAAQIDDGGNIKMFKHEIKQTELPPTVNNEIARQYKNFEIDEIEKVERNRDIFFQIELNGKQEQQLVFTENGRKDTSITYWD